MSAGVDATTTHRKVSEDENPCISWVDGKETGCPGKEPVRPVRDTVMFPSSDTIRKVYCISQACCRHLYERGRQWKPTQACSQMRQNGHSVSSRQKQWVLLAKNSDFPPRYRDRMSSLNWILNKREGFGFLLFYQNQEFHSLFGSDSRGVKLNVVLFAFLSISYLQAPVTGLFNASAVFGPYIPSGVKP